MRILFLDVAPFCGGAQQSLGELIGELSKTEEVAVATAGGLPIENLSQCQAVFPLTARHWPASLAGWRQFREDARSACPLLTDAIGQFHPDVIHANGLRSAMLLAVLQPPNPVVLQDRDIQAPWLLRNWIAHRLHPHLIGISQKVLQKWRWIPGLQGRSLLPNGFHWDAIRSIAPAQTTLPNILLLPADFVSWKRHLLFLDAVELLQRQKFHCTPVICGRSRGESAYEDAICHRAQELGVHIVKNQSALPWIQAAEIVVACGKNEPFGRTVLESLGCGKKTVVTRDGCARELQSLAGVFPSSKTTAEHLTTTIINAWQQPLSPPDLSPYSIQKITTRLLQILRGTG